jgi:hypothetical protein
MFAPFGAINVTTAKHSRQGETAMFTIDTHNNVAAHAAAPASTDNLQSFTSEKELAKLAADWPAARLVEFWNSFAGVTPFDDLKPVKKFTSRQAAVARIWSAVARLSPDGAQPAHDVAPTKAKSKKSARRSKQRDTARKGASEASNKKAEVIAMMKHTKGATLAEIVTTTGWQKHTVRGFISILASKGGQKIDSSKNAQGERTYRIPT